MLNVRSIIFLKYNRSLITYGPGPRLSNQIMIIKVNQYSVISVRADNRSYRLSAPIWAICRYIGFADKQNAYRHRLSVSADKDPYIGNLSDMLNYIWPLGGW